MDCLGWFSTSWSHQQATSSEMGSEDEGEGSLEGGGDGDGEVEAPMVIGGPTNVQHVTHVTFDKFQGFLGLPETLQDQTKELRRAPSAGVKVFGVSPAALKCGYDEHGNMVPEILLHLQHRLYQHQGLETEGIFRIAAEIEHEDAVRGQLNLGLVPKSIDVHAVAGLIKAWFRELPEGLLDKLSPEVLAQAESPKAMVALTRSLPEMERNLLQWVVELMADVVEVQDKNKMNSRNVAVVFAPNMTKHLDLKHAVKVMELLQVLVDKKRQDRCEDAALLRTKELPGEKQTEASLLTGLAQELSNQGSHEDFSNSSSSGALRSKSAQHRSRSKSLAFLESDAGILTCSDGGEEKGQSAKSRRMRRISSLEDGSVHPQLLPLPVPGDPMAVHGLKKEMLQKGKKAKTRKAGTRKAQKN